MYYAIKPSFTEPGEGSWNCQRKSPTLQCLFQLSQVGYQRPSVVSSMLRRTAVRFRYMGNILTRYIGSEREGKLTTG